MKSLLLQTMNALQLDVWLAKHPETAIRGSSTWVTPTGFPNHRTQLWWGTDTWIMSSPLQKMEAHCWDWSKAYMRSINESIQGTASSAFLWSGAAEPLPVWGLPHLCLLWQSLAEISCVWMQAVSKGLCREEKNSTAQCCCIFYHAYRECIWLKASKLRDSKLA